MRNAMHKTEDFNVLSVRGQRIHVRATVMVDTLHDTARTTYAGLLGRGIERQVVALGGNRFKIGGKEFRRLPERVGSRRSERLALPGITRLVWSATPTGLWIRVGVLVLVLALAQWVQTADSVWG